MSAQMVAYLFVIAACLSITAGSSTVGPSLVASISFHPSKYSFNTSQHAASSQIGDPDQQGEEAYISSSRGKMCWVPSVFGLKVCQSSPPGLIPLAGYPLAKYRMAISLLLITLPEPSISETQAARNSLASARSLFCATSSSRSSSTQIFVSDGIPTIANGVIYSLSMQCQCMCRFPISGTMH